MISIKLNMRRNQILAMMNDKITMPQIIESTFGDSNLTGAEKEMYYQGPNTLSSIRVVSKKYDYDANEVCVEMEITSKDMADILEKCGGVDIIKIMLGRVYGREF